MSALPVYRSSADDVGCFGAHTSLSRAREANARTDRTGLASLIYTDLIVLVTDTRYATRGLVVETLQYLVSRLG